MNSMVIGIGIGVVFAIIKAGGSAPSAFHFIQQDSSDFVQQDSTSLFLEN